MIFFPQQTKSFTAELHAKPEYHKFLIGKGGGNIRKVRDSTGARIIFPTAEDKDQELITVIGTEEAVQEAKKELEELIKSLVSLGSRVGSVLCLNICQNLLLTVHRTMSLRIP